MDERLSIEGQDARDHADKAAWREREGWCTAEEAEMTLSGKDGSHFELVEVD